MNKNNKAAFPTVGAEEKTASIQQKSQTNIIALLPAGQAENLNTFHVRRWIKTLLVHLACWELLPAALTVFLLGGLRND